MLWFGPVKIAYKFTNQSSKYTNGPSQLKSLNLPGESFYLSIIVERFTMYNLVVLYFSVPAVPGLQQEAEDQDQEEHSEPRVPRRVPVLGK